MNTVYDPYMDRMVCLPTLAIQINQNLVNKPYMDPMGDVTTVVLDSRDSVDPQSSSIS